MGVWVGNPAFGIILLAAVAARAAAAGADCAAINSRRLEIDYFSRSDTSSVTQVELWVTADGGRHWQLHSADDQHHSRAHSPIRLQVEQDSIYGLYIVLHSAEGVSSAPPQSGQSAQHCVLVDTSAPLVQIKQVQIVERRPPEPPMLVVSWTAYDAHLGDRPVSLFFQSADRPGWGRMAGCVPNIGRFDWPVPPELGGELQVKIEVVDRAGNLASDVFQTVVSRTVREIEAANFADSVNQARKGLAQASPLLQIDQPNRKLDPEKAQKLYELGLWHKQRGDHAIALERLLEAMNLDPQTTAPAFELAELYHSQGDYHGALDIYQGIVEQRPEDREALRGTALAMVALGKYPEALENLEVVLRSLPEDAETWLHAGDVFLMMGQPAQARQYWSEALRLQPKRSDIADQARKRMERYALGSKTR